MINFHDEAVLINSIMETEGWKKFLDRIDRRKKDLQLRIDRNETDIDIAAVEKRGDNITIVVVNKDEIKHEKLFWERLEGQIREWQIEAAKEPEKEGQSER